MSDTNAEGLVVKKDHVQYALMIVGGLVVVIGVALGFIPMHSGSTGCGSLFQPENNVWVAMQGLDWRGCEAATSTRKGIVWTVVIIGALIAAAGFGWMMRGREGQWAANAKSEAQG